MGYAPQQVQEGDEQLAAKAPKGFGGRVILELVEDFDGDTFKAVYTVRFAGAVYVLHAFLIKSRLRDAEMHHRARTNTGGRKP